MESLRCVIPRAGEVAIEPLSLPELAPERVRVRVRYSLISPGTELAIFNGTHIGLPDPLNTFAKYPFPAGYTAIGDIVAVGRDVTGWREGDAVFLHGRHQSLQDVDPARQVLIAAPRGVDPMHVPFARLLQISNTALVVTAAMRRDVVAVIGLGLIGNLAAQLFQRAGATVYGFDTLAARCAWARDCGIRNAVRVEGDVVDAVAAAAGGKVAMAVEATGAGALAVSCLRMVDDLGTVVLLGSPRDRVEMDIYDLIHRPGARLVGAHERLVPLLAPGALDRRTVTEDIFAGMAAGALNVGPLVSRIVPPHALAEAYRQLDSRKQDVIGVLLDWSQA